MTEDKIEEIIFGMGVHCTKFIYWCKGRITPYTKLSRWRFIRGKKEGDWKEEAQRSACLSKAGWKRKGKLMELAFSTQRLQSDVVLALRLHSIGGRVACLS